MSSSIPLPSPPHQPMRPPAARHCRAAKRAGAFVAVLVLAATAARADDGVDGSGSVDDVDRLTSDVVDTTVAAAEIPGLTARQLGKATTLLLAHRFDTSRDAVGDANLPRDVPLIAPTPKVPTSVSARPIRVDLASISAPPTQLQLIDGQSVEVHADGMPGANGPTRDPLAPVVPRAVNPADVTVGARWGAQDRIPAPLLSSISWTAQADVLAGAPGARSSAVRRTLRLTAQWDTFSDLTFGLAPGLQRVGGTSFQHYVAGVQASTVDQSKEARWRSYVEVAGEKLAPNRLIDNATATLRAGASYQTSTSTQLDLSVMRGTMAIPDTQSSVGLSVRF